MDKTKTKIDLNIAEEMIKEEDALEPKADLETLQDMMMSGVMYGHIKSKTNPKFKNYIFVTRTGMEIIDLVKTLSEIDKAAEFLANQIKENKMVLFVSTQPAAADAIEEFAKKLNFPYVKNRWIGGLMTNFKVISKRIENYKKMMKDLESGAFEKYTKKERVMINKDIERMKNNFGGLETLTKIPDVVFVVDSAIKGHNTAIREAKRMGIPIVGIIDSDDNPEIINYPIPANDHSKNSIEWIINRINQRITNSSEISG